MCQSISGVAVKSGDSVKVYTLRDEDSHEAIRKEYGIGDGLEPSARYQTPVELVPVRGLRRLEDMDFIFDDERPDWWDDEMTEEAKRQLFSVWLLRWDGDILSMKGSLNLGSLTSIPKGVTLKAGGDLYLGRLTSIAQGVTLKAGGDLYLERLTSIPKGVTLKVGGDLYLGRLTTIAKGCRFSAASYYTSSGWYKTSAEMQKAVAALQEGWE